MTDISADLNDGKTVVEAFYAAIIAGDVEKMASMLHPEIEVEVTPHVPWGGRYCGKAHFLTCMPRVAASIDNSGLGVAHMISEGDRVFAIVTANTKRGDPLIVGEDWQVRDGMIHRARIFYYDARGVTEHKP